MQKRFIAIDPGEQTGWAIGMIGDGSMTVEQFGYDPWKKFVLTYTEVMNGARPFDVVIYESFRIRATAAKGLTGSTVPTAQCIGCIKLGAWQTGAQIFTSEPSNKPVIDRQMGGTDYLPKRDQVEHYRDAVRHAYWFAVNKEGIHPDDTRTV